MVETDHKSEEVPKLERLQWATKSTASFVFNYTPNSYAARVIENIGARAEEGLERGVKLLGLAPIRTPIIIYLADWFESPDAQKWTRLGLSLVDARNNVLWQFISPESPAVGLHRAILEILSRENSNLVSPDADMLLLGISGLTEFDQTYIVEAERAIYEEYERGKTPLQLFQSRSEAPSSPSMTDVSFLAFLCAHYGLKRFADFAQKTITDGFEIAFQSSYSNSLETLRDEWISTLRARWGKHRGVAPLLIKVFRMLGPYRVKVAQLATFTVCDLVCSLAIPLSAKFLYDDIIAVNNYNRLLTWAIVVILVFGLGSFSHYRRTVIASNVGDLVLSDLRVAGFNHLQDLPLSFYARSKTGELVSRIMNDMANVQTVLGQGLPELIYQSLSLVAIVIVLLALNWKLSLIVLLLGIPTYTFIYIRNSRKFYDLGRGLQEQIGSTTAFVHEVLSGHSVVKSFSLQRQFSTLFKDYLTRLLKTSVKLNELNAFISGSNSMISLGMRVLVLAIGGLLVMKRSMTIGELVAFVTLSAQALVPVWSLANNYQRLQIATGSFERIEELFDEQAEDLENPLTIELPALEREIELEHVTFNYSSGEPRLNDISLRVPARSRIAIVGPSGSGKSTLVGLMLRFYDPTSGRILFDGRDIRTATISSLRKQFAVVPQETYMFNMSIADNISLGKVQSTPEEIKQAARDAAIHDVVRGTEAGYKTIIGERGVRLSGGQRQRLAIARAIVRNPQIIILDEATSSLDSLSETAVLETLDRISRDRTTIIITHRLACVTHCDNIFVIDNGHLVEQGTHAQLSRAGGIYQRLFDEQFGEHRDLRLAGISREEVRHLRDIPLFANLDNPALTMLAKMLAIEVYSAGEHIYEQGDPADRLFIIRSGQVNVFVGDPLMERHVNTLQAGEYFGEIGLIENDLRTAMVRAGVSTQVYSLTKLDFLALLQREPTISRAVMTTMEVRRAELAAARVPVEARLEGVGDRVS